MSVPRLKKACAWCGATFFGDCRHKYCSEECAKDAHRKKSRENFRVRYETMHEQELERNRDYYRRNAEKCNARSAAWYQQNTERKREYSRNYRHARKEAVKNVGA